MIKDFFKLQPAFQLNIFFFGVLVVLTLFAYKMPDFYNLLIIYLSLILFQIFLSKTANNSVLVVIRDIALPVFSVLVAFDTIGLLIPYLNPHDIDQILVELDYLILGFYPYIFFEKIANPFLTEIMQISYCFYYFLPFIIGFYLLRNGNKTEFYRVLFLILLCYYLSYTGYMIFPALGPRYSIENAFHTSLQGVFIADKINAFLNQLEGIKRDAFPSGHVGISLLVLALMYKHSKKLFWLSLLPVLFLILSTIYCRYHYFVDVLGGILLTVVTLCMGNLYYNFWLRKNGDSFSKRQERIFYKGAC